MTENPTRDSFYLPSPGSYVDDCGVAVTVAEDRQMLRDGVPYTGQISYTRPGAVNEWEFVAGWPSHRRNQILDTIFVVHYDPPGYVSAGKPGRAIADG
jgi:hypothetical protein